MASETSVLAAARYRHPLRPEPTESVDLRHLWRFLGFTLPYWRSLTAGAVTGLVRMGVSLLMPWYFKYIIDEVAKPYLAGDIDADIVFSRWGAMTALICGAMVIHCGATFGRFYFPHRAMASAVRDIRYRLFRHLQRLSLGFHTRRPTGGIVARVMSDVLAAQQAFDMIFIQIAQEVLRIGVIGVVLLVTDWRWGLVTFAVMPLYVITTRLIRRPMRKVTRQQRETVERMSGFVQERFAMIREVQSFTAEDIEERQVLGEAETLRKQVLRERLYSGSMWSASEITQFLGLTVVLAFGVYRMTHGGDVTVGDLVLFFGYARLVLQPMRFFSQMYARLQASAASADRVFEFFDTEPDIQNASKAKPLTITTAPRVTLDKVCFSYPADDPTVVLDEVTFEAPPGSKVVLVGESGAGKSTLMSLLPRFYDAQKGHITLDGQDIREVTLRSLRQAIAVVPQEPVLFSGSIRENIRYGRPDASEEEIFAAARDANAEEFILAATDGYDTIVGERGVGLSGGQVQRVAIARAFLKDPTVLIMDEPTSNLDATSEALMLQAVQRLAAGRTTFIIAHRLSIARGADLIVALDAGKVAEIGTHAELLEARGVYHGLWMRQVGGEAMPR